SWSARCSYPHCRTTSATGSGGPAGSPVLRSAGDGTSSRLGSLLSGSQPVQRSRVRQLGEASAGEGELRATDAAPEDGPWGLGHPPVDQQRPVGRKSDRRAPAVLHPGLLHRPILRRERRLAYVQLPPYEIVDVDSGVSED